MKQAAECGRKENRMSRLRKFFKNYRRQAVLAPIFKLLEALMNLLVPLAVGAIINNGIGNADRNYIIRMFIVLLVLAVLGMLFSFVAQWYAANASVGFAAQMRQALFDHIQKLSFTEIDTLRPDTLITRMTSDANQVQNGLNLALRLLLRSPFIVFGSMILAFTIDVKSALVFAVAIPVLTVVVFAIMLASIPLFTKSQKALDRLTGLTRENLSGARVIRAFCKEQQEVDEFDRRNEALTHINERVGRLSALMNPLTYVIINIATIVLIHTGALQVSLGALRQGDVVALYNYMAQIIIELIKLASLIITINKSLACANRIADVFDIQPGMTYPAAEADFEPAGRPDGETATAPAVRFDNVSFTYAGASDAALSDVSFTAAKGSTIGIIGGTGCGKSTLVSLIARFYDATRGCVSVNGRDVRSYPEGALTGRIGFVPQKAVLFRGTVRDNLRWGNESADDESLWEALDAAQAKDVIEGKPGGLSFLIEQNGRNLSGGQKQRLTIARALVKKPEILIMDDSASALDFATDLALRRAVRALEGSMTIFIVSQRASSIRDADGILVLDDGRLAGKGTHKELMKSCRVYREIYYSQYPDEKPEDTTAGKEQA